MNFEGVLVVFLALNEMECTSLLSFPHLIGNFQRCCYTGGLTGPFVYTFYILSRNFVGTILTRPIAISRVLRVISFRQTDRLTDRSTNSGL